MQKKIFKELITAASKEGIYKFVAAGIILRKGEVREVLLLRRPAAEFMGGIYELPSGKVEPGEALDAALKREVWEETGLKVNKVLKYIGRFDFKGKTGDMVRQFNFLVSVEDFSEIRLTEHDAYAWVCRIELKNYKVSEKTLAAVSSVLK